MEKYLASVERAKKIGRKPISKAQARSNLGYGSSKDNIGNLSKFGFICFSPPYFDAIKKGCEGPYADNKRIPYSERIKQFKGYSEDKSNIGNISKFGRIVFSPPYFDAISIKKVEEARTQSYTKSQLKSCK